MKRITFSRTFPSYHPKAGQPTHFVEKMHRSFLELGLTHPEKVNAYYGGYKPYAEMDCWKYEPKYHTVRAGKNWKAGDKFTPVVWSGKPYRSKQIIIAPEIEIKKVWDFEIKSEEDLPAIYMPDRSVAFKVDDGTDEDVAKNDGLNYFDFIDWFTLSPEFKKTTVFAGQIICWNENVNY